MEKEKSFDQFKYQNEYVRQKYDRIQLVVPKGEKERIKAVATSLGQSTNEFIWQAVRGKL